VVDRSAGFVAQVLQRARMEGLENLEGMVNRPQDSGLSPATVDMVFLCETYHHCEYPRAMLASIRRALRSAEALVVADYERIPGISRLWLLNHVRAGKDGVIEEIGAAGFQLEEDRQGLLAEHYFLRFRVAAAAAH